VKVKVLEKVDKNYKIRIEEKIMPQSQLILKFAKRTRKLISEISMSVNESDHFS